MTITPHFFALYNGGKLLIGDPMKSETYKSYSVLFAATFAFVMTFMVWMTFAVIGIPLREELGLSATEFGFLTATPILSGSLIRLPLGIWTDRFGGRKVMLALLLICVPFCYLISYATAYWHFLAIGLVMGLAGGSFSVGTPYVARWFPKSKQGLATGIFGMGTVGTALNNVISPLLLAHFDSWRTIPQVYAGLLLLTAVIFWFTGYHNPNHIVKNNQSISKQFALLKDPKVLRYAQYYTVTFGGYVGLSLWLTNFYVNEYHFDLSTAAALALAFMIPGGALRVLGGYLGDKFGANRVAWTVMWVLWVVFLVLSIPQMTLLVQGAHGVINLQVGMGFHLFTMSVFLVGATMATGSAAIFKSIADEYPENIGTVSGIVGLAGGLFGFILPIAFGVLFDLTWVRTTAFMLMFSGVSLSLIWMHFAFKKQPIFK